MSRFTLLPIPAAESLRAEVDHRLEAAARMLDRNTFFDVFDGRMRETLRVAFSLAGGHEGTVWLVNRERSALVPVHNTGQSEEEFLRQVSAQPLTSGLVSGVFLREQSHCENAVSTHVEYDSKVDRLLALQTTAEIAVPLRFAGAVRGVISCVRLAPGGTRDQDDPGFNLEAFRSVEFGTEVVGRLLDLTLLEIVLGRSR